MDNCRAVPLAVDEATVEIHDKALAVVQRLLTERGIRAHRHHTISLGLFANSAAAWPDQPPLRSWMERHPPELTVKGPQGWCEATVTMGARSGSYLVSLRNGSDLQAVRSEHPEEVVKLILAARVVTVYGWIILGNAATKRVNGQEVVVTAGKPGDIGAVIRAWEDAERHRMLYELGNLGRLVDAAMTRLQFRHRTSGSRGEHAAGTGDTS